jgi:hypothetical protein
MEQRTDKHCLASCAQRCAVQHSRNWEILLKHGLNAECDADDGSWLAGRAVLRGRVLA